jgi:hypothetical protein
VEDGVNFEVRRRPFCNFAESERRGLLNPYETIQTGMVFLVSHVGIALIACCSYVNVVMSINMESTIVAQCYVRGEVVDPNEGDIFPVARVKYAATNWNVDACYKGRPASWRQSYYTDY